MDERMSFCDKLNAFTTRKKREVALLGESVRPNAKTFLKAVAQ